MSLEIVTSFNVLMQKAKAVGDTKKAGDSAELVTAQKEHDEYKKLCLLSDKITIGVLYGSGRE